jgi:hypothetical protein
MANFLNNLFSKNESASFIKAGEGVVSAALALEPEISALSPEGIRERVAQVRERTKGVIESDKDIAEVFRSYTRGG